MRVSFKEVYKKVKSLKFLYVILIVASFSFLLGWFLLDTTSVSVPPKITKPIPEKKSQYHVTSTDPDSHLIINTGITVGPKSGVVIVSKAVITPKAIQEIQDDYAKKLAANTPVIPVFDDSGLRASINKTVDDTNKNADAIEP